MQEKVAKDGRHVPFAAYDVCCQWSSWPPQDDEKIVLGDVLKVCLVVVGEDHKRSEAPLIHGFARSSPESIN